MTGKKKAKRRPAPSKKRRVMAQTKAEALRAKKKAAKKASSKKRISSKAAAYEMLRDPKAAAGYLKGIDLSRDSVLRLAKALAGHPALLELVEMYRAGKGYPALGEGKGRGAPVAGEERDYKNQQGDAGGTYIRLPLDVLGAVKGGVTRVKFTAGKITATRV